MDRGKRVNTQKGARTEDGQATGTYAQALSRAPIDRAIRPLILDLGCCGASAIQIGAPGYGLPGYDGSAYDLEPEQANVLIVAGRISSRLAPALQGLIERMAKPRWVIAYGACAISGAVYDTVQVAQLVRVDLFIGGCPPPAEALLGTLARLPRRRAP